MKNILIISLLLLLALIPVCQSKKTIEINFCFDNPYSTTKEELTIDSIRVLDISEKTLHNIRGDVFNTENHDTSRFTIVLSAFDRKVVEYGVIVELTYYDDKEKDVSLCIINENTLLPLKEGGLLFSGSGDTRRWRIVVHDFELSYGVNEQEGIVNYVHILPKKTVMPLQYASSFKMFDNNELVHMCIEMFDNAKEEYYQGYMWVISPYILAKQILQGIVNSDEVIDYANLHMPMYQIEMPNEYHYNSSNTLKAKDVAYHWLLDNAISINANAFVWPFSYPNSYNDLEQLDGWVSAFPQKYILDAFIFYDNKEYVEKAVNAYLVPTEEGGITFFGADGTTWFEEVPNNSHILNAHIASLNSLGKAREYLGTNKYNDLYSKALKSLEDRLHLYDTGYWSRYDLNPRKEILFQIDWLTGTQSPLIDTIHMRNPQTLTETVIDVGSGKDWDYPSISGSQWQMEQEIDGANVRGFDEGYLINEAPVDGGSLHNVYFWGVLPEREWDDYFDVPVHEIVIKYKDVAIGSFAIKPQSIAEGDYLQFVSIPDSVIECVGDGEWKEIVVPIRPQDMGWFMGEEYQIYHIEQLQELAETTNSWRIRQYVEKWEYYLERYRENKATILKSAA